MTSRVASRRAPNVILQEMRINAGLSPNDLAARAHTTGNTVRLAEKGFPPGPRIQFQIAKALGCLPLDIWPMDKQPRVAR